ncbi:MAG TPA: hypothetical protein VFP72_15760 [Kineosporiaceae bacterium]|nr:hypothetical protein [Kineosporiaceae bacterium]
MAAAAGPGASGAGIPAPTTPGRAPLGGTGGASTADRTAAPGSFGGPAGAPPASVMPGVAAGPVHPPAAGVAGRDAGEEERLRHAIASQALSELSQLSTYRPERVSQTPLTPLVRRTPAVPTEATAESAGPGAGGDGPAPAAGPHLRGAEEPEGEPAVSGWAAAVGEGPAGRPGPDRSRSAVPGQELPPIAPAPRARDAEQLRRTLSGFQSGMRRGRGEAFAHRMAFPAPRAPREGSLPDPAEGPATDEWRSIP